MKTSIAVFAMTILVAGAAVVPALSAVTPSDEERVYEFVGKSERYRLGPAGIEVKYDTKNKVLTVIGTEPETPAHGHFKAGDVLAAVNGKSLNILNPFVVIGEAITNAEATEGKLLFGVISDGKKRDVALRLPVLGRYSATWPLNCPKSKKIIANAAAYYSRRGKQKGGLDVALQCLFLLSTGDDQYLPLVKHYVHSFNDPETGKTVVGGSTWHVGYQGIVIAEYYLRTGDRSALPVLQAFCDKASKPIYGIAWGHGFGAPKPDYGAGGGVLNPATVPILTYLLLGKECGVNINETALQGILKYLYRFAGRGGVGYGDGRMGGNYGHGNDGMLASAMQVAMGAQGDTSIYRKARDVLSMKVIDNYSGIARGHGSGGIFDAMWRGIATSYLLESRPSDCRAMMNRLAWWYDIARHANGAMGMAMCRKMDNPSWGSGMALTYTAPLRTLRITGAPRSKYAKTFTLPEQLWGNKADLAFHAISNHPDYYKYGKEEPAHIPLRRMGTMYAPPSADLKTIPRNYLLKNIYHRNYTFRAQAAKALRATGRIDDLQKLLSEPDARIRRAALEGILDWRYFHGVGKNPLQEKEYTPAIISAIIEILSNPDESWFVTEAALFAMKNMPADVIQKNVPAILPWTKSKEWWLRDAAFQALTGLDKDEELFTAILPTLFETYRHTSHDISSQRMLGYFRNSLKVWGSDTKIGKLMIDGVQQGLQETKIAGVYPGNRGSYKKRNMADFLMEYNPQANLSVARELVKCLPYMDDLQLIKLISSPQEIGSKELRPWNKHRRVVFYEMPELLPEKEGNMLKEMLYSDFRREFCTRIKNKAEMYSKNPNGHRRMINTLLDLKKLKEKDAGWQDIGSPGFKDCTWRFTSFDPVVEKDKRSPKQVSHRLRWVTMPKELSDWLALDYDDSNWQSGKAPIGRGKWGGRKDSIKDLYASDWGAGEFLAVRSVFEVADLKDYDYYRLNVLAKNGWRVWLNGTPVQSWTWYSKRKYIHYWLKKEQVDKLLKKGKNVLCVLVFKEYPGIANPKGWPDTPELGAFDCYFQGLMHSELEMAK